MSPDPNLPPPAPVESLQFRHVEAADGVTANARRCQMCKSPILTTYFQVAGKDFCPDCTSRLQSIQQAPTSHSLIRAALYGGGAAIAGCAIYAFVAIALHLELALIAILIGYMVGRAVRTGSEGLGGRPQQILAVLLTYFAITFSSVAVYVYSVSQNSDAAARMSFAGTAATLVSLAAIAPLLELGSNPIGGLLSLVIIFFGLQRAWRMTGRPEIDISGPYSATEAS